MPAASSNSRAQTSAAKTTRPRRSARAFLRQIADELPSHLPPKWRGYDAELWSRHYKIWFTDPKIHFEVQFLRNGNLEIGLHLEAGASVNERIGDALEKKRAGIEKALGPEAKFGSHGRGWVSIAERWSGGSMRAEEAATEAASRLGQYVAAIAPLLPAAMRAES
jgi:hypothetical protein